VLFAIGNGQDEENRSDALQVDALGNLTASGKIIASGQDVLLLIGSMQAQIDTLQTQLEALQLQITELGGN
jgi:hypothetical protein